MFQFGDLDLVESCSALYGNGEVEDLATHFQVPVDDTLTEWNSFKELLLSLNLDSRQMQGPDLLSCISKCTRKSSGNPFPNVIFFISVAAVLPLSTAEVERVFSDVNRTVTELRNRRKVTTTNKLLHLHRNEIF